MKKVILTVIVAALTSSCSKKVENKDIIITEVINMEHRPLNFESSKRENNAHQGQYYSTVDSISKFGIGYDYVLHDSLKKNNLMVYISCWVREPQLPVEGKISIGLSDSKGIKSWNESGVKNDYKPGEWVEIKDSILYPSSELQDQFVKVGIVAIKNTGSDAFDVDDLKIKYRFFK